MIERSYRRVVPQPQRRPTIDMKAAHLEDDTMQKQTAIIREEEFEADEEGKINTGNIEVTKKPQMISQETQTPFELQQQQLKGKPTLLSGDSRSLHDRLTKPNLLIDTSGQNAREAQVDDEHDIFSSVKEVVKD